MAQQRFGAFDRYGNPIQSGNNPAYTGQPVAPPVLKPMPSPAPLPLFSPADLPRAPSVQPQGALPAAPAMQFAGGRGLLNRNEQQAMDELYPPERPDPNAPPPPNPNAPSLPAEQRGLWRRALDAILPPAGASELGGAGTSTMPNAGPRRYVGAGSDYPTPARQPFTGDLRDLFGSDSPTPAAQWGGTGGDMGGALTQNIGNRRIGFDQNARDRYLAVLTGQPVPAPIGSTAPSADQFRGFVSNVAHGANNFAGGTKMLGSNASNARRAPALPPASTPDAIQPAYPDRQYPTSPLSTSESRRAAPGATPQPAGMPMYQMGANGALTLAMPGGGTAELTPAPGANRLAVRASELAGQPLGGGQYVSDAQVAARRPDLYGADGKPLLADRFGNARDPGLDAQLAEAQAYTQALQGNRPSPMVRGMMARADAASESAASARGAGTAASRRELASRLYAQAQQAQQDEQQGALAREQNATTRRGQDLQLAAGRGRSAPIPVGTPDGGHVLYDPNSGQWLSPPGTEASGGLSKQDSARLKDIGSELARAMGMDKNDIALQAGQGAIYTNALRIGGASMLATRGMPAFAQYTPAHYAQIGQDVDSGRAEIKFANGMAYAMYRDADGQALGGVPIGSAIDYAAFRPQAPAAPATR